ncbi:hypothetical protein [Simiduia litorea]|uniref:hypothetical protein n=1 Tax=Simiduia litorea TaxID=1435348 RepID=UPI0036F2D896
MKYLMFLLALFLSLKIQAIEVADQEIESLGAYTGQTIFMYLKSDVLAQSGCVHQVLYCPSSNPDCSAMLSIALAAKTTSSKIYLSCQKNTSGQCIMDHIKF